jgi:hypothetical protein
LRRGLSNLGSSNIIGRSRRCQLTTCLWLFSVVINAFWGLNVPLGHVVSQRENRQRATPYTVQSEMKIRISYPTLYLPSRLFRNSQSFVRKKALEKFLART